jgi:glutathione S-transferase
MKLYDCKAAANPRSIRMALAEKAIDVECVQIDLFKAEQHGEAFRRINPFGSVPCLELDDGAVIGESAAIARYFEARQPEPRLLGSTPKEQAVIAMWQRRVEDSVLNAATTFLHHATSGLARPAGTATPTGGMTRRVRRRPGVLDLELAGRAYVAGDGLSFADHGDLRHRLRQGGGIELPTASQFEGVAYAHRPVRAPPPNLKMADKVAVLAALPGFGAAIAKGFADAGYRVGLARSPEFGRQLEGDRR